MIRDTFEVNPGLCELFKRKILDKARDSGLSEDLIDFQTQIDMKGSYQDNLRIFYREYPQLARSSDYVKLKLPHPLSGAALEQSWRSYERNRNRSLPIDEKRAEGHPGTAGIIPELTVTYTVGREAATWPNGSGKEPGSMSRNERPLVTEAGPMQVANPQLSKLLMDRIAAVAGEKVTKTILHQTGREIGRTALHHPCSNQCSPESHIESLERSLKILGFGRVEGLEEVYDGLGITYKCTIGDCLFCHKGAAGDSACDVMRGVVTCWLESLLKKKAERIEADCVNNGRHLCVFRVTFAK